MSPATTIPEAVYEPLPRSAGAEDFVAALRRVGRLGTQTAVGVADIFTGAARLALRCAVSVHAWISSRGHKAEDPLLTLVEAARYRTVFNRISAAANLSTEERQIVEAISSSVRKTYQAGSEIVVEGEVLPRPMIIASGWACRRRTRGNGRAQVLGFLAPGDGIGLRGSADMTAPCTLLALTTVETIDATQLLRLAHQSNDYSGIAGALLKAVAEDEEFLTNQIIRLGSPSPVERLAHLLLEMHARLSAAGLATDRDFFMPMTYETLAEALAVTPKIARRSMKSLKRKGLAKFRYGRVKLLAPHELQRMSDFTPPDLWADRTANA
ncbi:MAG TPA: Crp/Fnr family transcriptional regulator [Hyphomonadaceae bacterium]|nr:Crp/Fnr family transcriptional regulator [Hyphomonadaceae bacterium]